MDAKQKITKARAGLILDQPFFGSLALKMPLKEDSACQTMWTDGKTIGYNPGFIDNLSLSQIKGVFAHEIMHCALSHNTRRQGRERGKWNTACDYAVNPIIINSGFELPNGHLDNPAYQGKTVDEIYNMLPPDQSQNQGQNQKQGQGQEQNPDPGGCGEVRDLPGQNGQSPSPSEIFQNEQDWKVAVTQAAQQAKAMGHLPGEIDRLVNNLVNPKIDWRSLLRQFIQMNAKNDYSWSPPNRRFIHQGLYLPSLRSEEINNIVLAVDTSGSIAQSEIDQFSAEISSILEEYNTNIYVLYCDTKISGTQEISSHDLPLVLTPSGGGGTDFRPPFEWIEKEGIEPACMIYLTDLECNSYPDSIPGHPVLWIATTDRYSAPPFGDVIELS